MASVVQDVVSGAGSVVQGVGSLFKPPKAPSLQTPNALSTQPTQADASKTAIQKTLTSEQKAASTSSILTSGQGLLDQPTTTSRTLLGN